jgi:hypothetical protein
LEQSTVPVDDPHARKYAEKKLEETCIFSYEQFKKIVPKKMHSREWFKISKTTFNSFGHWHLEQIHECIEEVQ